MIKAGATAEPRFTKKALVPMCTEVRLGVTWYAYEILKIAMSPGIPRGESAQVLGVGFGCDFVHKVMRLEGHIKVDVSPALVFQIAGEMPSQTQSRARSRVSWCYCRS